MDGFGRPWLGFSKILKVILVGLWGVLEGSWRRLGEVLGGLGDGLGEQGATRQKKSRKRVGALPLKGGVWGELWQPKSIQEGKKSKKRGIKQES